ncbi:ABC transporter ATP-binding protein [Candidatus Acetothermia bacterium]|jgi:ABC-2 type transport system ATP-binding protein|nr:ABC transporter ATP-binding protein [Candidatus Acetothermia bacterium]MCI2427322.1 ABC transporter ATP-binding protein [Candidatus Acetothermia bacterium]MCI2428862.1 ABC transporter ATP-binding protein [Candidatus Acetothermia bacterium]
MNLVEIRNLTRKFGRLTAVDNVSFEIRKEEVLGLLGPNGAGKSTIIDMIVGLRKPTSGSVLVYGLDSSKNGLEVRRRVGYVPQQAAVFDDLTVRENLSLAAEMYGISSFKQRVAEIIKEYDLGEKADKLTHTLSGGQRRQLNFALGSIPDSQLMILDEPTVGLDPTRRLEAWEFIRRFQEKGKTVLLTTHYMEEADALCSRIVLIDRGKIVAQGRSEELKATLSDELLIEYTFAEMASDELVERLTGLQGVLQVEHEGLSLEITLKRSALPHVQQLVHESKLLIRNSSQKEVTLNGVFFHYTGRQLIKDKEE